MTLKLMLAAAAVFAFGGAAHAADCCEGEKACCDEAAPCCDGAVSKPDEHGAAQAHS